MKFRCRPSGDLLEISGAGAAWERPIGRARDRRAATTSALRAQNFCWECGAGSTTHLARQGAVPCGENVGGNPVPNTTPTGTCRPTASRVLNAHTIYELETQRASSAGKEASEGRVARAPNRCARFSDVPAAVEPLPDLNRGDEHPPTVAGLTHSRKSPVRYPRKTQVGCGSVRLPHARRFGSRLKHHLVRGLAAAMRARFSFDLFCRVPPAGFEPVLVLANRPGCEPGCPRTGGARGGWWEVAPSTSRRSIGDKSGESLEHGT